MLDYVLLARARKMLADEATTLHRHVRILESSDADVVGLVVIAEACEHAASGVHSVLSKADAFLDDEQAREALRHE
jgi:hypothetical protein